MATTVAFKCLIHTTTSSRLQMRDGYDSGAQLLHRVGDTPTSSPSQYIFFYLLLLLTPLIISGICVWTTNIHLESGVCPRPTPGVRRLRPETSSSPAPPVSTTRWEVQPPCPSLAYILAVMYFHILLLITDDEIYTVFYFWILYWLLNWVYKCLNLLFGAA